VIIAVPVQHANGYGHDIVKIVLNNDVARVVLSIRACSSCFRSGTFSFWGVAPYASVTAFPKYLFLIKVSEGYKGVC